MSRKKVVSQFENGFSLLECAGDECGHIRLSVLKSVIALEQEVAFIEGKRSGLSFFVECLSIPEGENSDLEKRVLALDFLKFCRSRQVRLIETRRVAHFEFLMEIRAESGSNVDLRDIDISLVGGA